MTDNAANPVSAATIAVLHRACGVVRAVAGSVVPEPRVTAWAELPDGDEAALAGWLKAQDARRAVVILPASATVCRTCPLPDADEDHLRQALALQAEAALATEMPPHRQSMAVLGPSDGETTRSGIVVAWPPRPADAALAPPGTPRETTFAPDVAALAALLDGQRPEAPLFWFDRANGSLALAVSHANGVVFRAARIGDGTPEAWAANAGRALAETALSANLTPDYSEALARSAAGAVADGSNAAGLVAPRSVLEAAAARLQGAPEDPSWWGTYGIAAAALLAEAGPLAPLARLQLDAPRAKPSLARRAVDALSRPRTAAATATVCALIVVLGPLLFSGLRLGVLRVKLGELDAYLKQARQAEVQLAMYDELASRTWPMTKLLSDIACATPVNLEVDQVRIRGGEPVTITGLAKGDVREGQSAQETVALMQDNLRATGIFEKIYLSWGDPNSFNAYEFTLSARVKEPYRRYEYPRELDFADFTYAERLYGEREVDEGEAKAVDVAYDEEPVEETAPADEAPPPVKAGAETYNGERATDRQAGARVRDPFRSPRGGDEPASVTDQRPGPAKLPASQDVPEPLTPEQIEVMTIEEAQETLTRLSQALQRARVDKETRERLWTDWRAVRERWRELDRGAKGGDS